MPDPPEVVRLFWDGYDVQREDLDIFLEIEEGLDEMPELRTYRHVVPFRHGQRADPSFAGRRSLVLGGWIAGPRGSALPGFRGYVDEVKDRFSPLRAARGLPEEGLLVAELEDGTIRWIHAVPLDIRYPSRAPGNRRTTIGLEALDPFWYSAYGAMALDAGIDLDDDHFLELGSEIVLASSMPELMVMNPGSAEVERVRVRFSGPSATSIGIENLSTPQLVGFGSAEVLAAGDRITVDNYQRRARRDQGASQGNVRGSMTLRVGNRHGGYLYLVPGTNHLRILGAPTECRIFFSPTHL